MARKRVKKGYGTYYLYKDKFMSGWGPAKRGSYVITDAPVRRPEFKKIAESSSWLGFRFRSGKDRDFQLWEGIRDERVGRPKKICKLYVEHGGLHVKECRRN